MVPRSQADQGTERLLIEAQLRECYGRVVYSHKTHEKCADILLTRLSRIKLLQIILSSITAAGFLGVILGAGTLGAVVGAIVATVLLVLNAYTKNYDLGELAQKHRQAAAELWLLREKYLALITDLRVGTEPLGGVTKRRDEILDDLHAVYTGAPSTTYKAYKKAQEAIQQSEEMSFTDEEIDALLPKELRRSEAVDAADIAVTGSPPGPG